MKENRMEPITYTGDKGYKLGDVLDKKVTMEEFVAQLSDDDLICMFRGEGLPMCRRAAEAKASIPVCPFWQRREQEKGDEDGKPQEGICAAVL